MVMYTKQYSSPVHIENTILNMTKEDLKLSNGNAFKTYRNMMFDPTISGAMSFILSVLNKPFYFKPHPKSTKRERELVEALNQSLKELSPQTLNRVMSNILTLISFGTSIQEVTWHRVQGKQVFKSFSHVALEQVNKFEFNKGYLQNIELAPPSNDGLLVDVSNQPLKITGDKLLVTSFQADSSLAPLGKSLLHGCYTTWKQKTIYEELGLTGASKSLAGVSKISIPSEYLNSYFSDPTSDSAILVENLIKQAEMLGQGKTSFVALPSDTTEGNSRLFDVESFSGVDRGGFELESSIQRCDRQLHQALQASVLSLAQDGSGSGSYGLSDTKSVLLHQFLKGVHATIASEMRKILRKTFELNSMGDSEHLPEVVFEELQQPTWEEFTSGLKELGMSGFVEPTGELDHWIKDYIGAPTQGGTGDTGTGLMRTIREQEEFRQEQREVNNDAE